MKKAIALLLCLLMMTSLVACGSNNTATDDSQTSQVETENNETSTPEESEETPTEAETETPVENEKPTEESEPTVSVGWEIEGSVIPIPEPPVTQYSMYNKGDSDGYLTNEIVWLKSDEIMALTEEDISAYVDELVAAGYDQISRELAFEEDGGFHFKAGKEDGISSIYMEGMIDGGYLLIGVDVPVNAQ